MTNYAIITAAGIGKRMQSSTNKIFQILAGEPILLRTLSFFNKSELIDKIIVVARKEDHDEIKRLKESNGLTKIEKVVLGGDNRQNSVNNGIISLHDAVADDLVIIHNGVNPFLDETTLKNAIEAAKKYDASVVGFRARDTIKEADDKGFVAKTLDRSKLWQVQTPQIIKFGLAKKAFKDAHENGIIATDDVALVERLGKKVKLIECPHENIKITLPGDLEFANNLTKNSKIGFGIDSHKFLKEGDKKLVIGGIELEGSGFDANSDGDVILHALFNAISSALGERSLGHYADKMCKTGTTDSKEYLKVITDIMKNRGYNLGNVSIMLEGKTPKIEPIHDNLKESIANILNLNKENIGITATSGEGLSPFGKGEGMQCYSAVTLNR